MDYFRILNLKKEPFSNSPEPEFFFQSPQHLGCLQNLELSIRLLRGLNVVIGDIGTGKTTLCRQLILQFSPDEENKESVETHLILDPAFSNALEFLSTVATTFGIESAGTADSEWKLKETIKNYLFKKGIDDGRIVVLIIDEGQKLPDFCYEILREFLNYETNDHKLLQIVIFAQQEFEQHLKEHQNFADRINQYYFLKPLNFRETRAMIKFRIAKACEGEMPPPLFSGLAFFALYRETGGYPRKIVTLCHRIILTLLIQNRSRAGWFLVRSCAYRIAPPRPRRWNRFALAALAVFIIAAVGSLMVFDPLRLMTSSPREGKAPVPSPVAASPQPGGPSSSPVDDSGNRSAHTPDAVPKPGTSAVPSPVPSGQAVSDARGVPPAQPASGRPGEVTGTAVPHPDMLGQVTIVPGGNVTLMLKRIYGYTGPALLKSVGQANPGRKDFSQVREGDTINIPALPLRQNPLLKGRQKFWVQVASKKSLEEAYRFLINPPPNQPPFRLLSYRNIREGIVFAILLKDGFDDEAAARTAVSALPSALAADARVISRWDADTVFFTG